MTNRLICASVTVVVGLLAAPANAQTVASTEAVVEHHSTAHSIGMPRQPPRRTYWWCRKPR